MLINNPETFPKQIEVIEHSNLETFLPSEIAEIRDGGWLRKCIRA